MRVKVKSLKRICIVLGIISLFLCLFVLVRNAIYKSKAIDYINESIYYKVGINDDVNDEQMKSIENSINKISSVSSVQKNNERVFEVRVKINSIGDINEDFFISIQKNIEKIDGIKNIDTNFDEVLKYYGIYGYKEFINELNN